MKPTQLNIQLPELTNWGLKKKTTTTVTQHMPIKTTMLSAPAYTVNDEKDLSSKL
jgi:hypothetical protein